MTGKALFHCYECGSNFVDTLPPLEQGVEGWPEHCDSFPLLMEPLPTEPRRARELLRKLEIQP